MNREYLVIRIKSCRNVSYKNAARRAAIPKTLNCSSLLQVLEVYGISAVVNSVLILYQFENNDTAYTDNPIAVLFGVAILLFMRKN